MSVRSLRGLLMRLKLLILLAPLSLAGSVQGQGTYTAASCSFADVNSCVNGVGATCRGSSEGLVHSHEIVVREV